MTLTFYDGLGDMAYCNCCPPLPASSHPDASALTGRPFSLSLPLFLDIKKRSIILDAPPCRLPLR